MGATNARPDNDPSPGTCDGKSLVFHQHRAHVLLKDAYALERWAKGPKRSEIRSAQAHRRCIRVAKVRRAIAELRDKLAERLREYAAEQRQVASLTPYPGPNGSMWAIPWSIVACESGGDFGARNASSTAGGAYQILNTTWYGYGGTHYADSHPAAVAPPDEQHLIASRIWSGGAGRSQWEC